MKFFNTLSAREKVFLALEQKYGKGNVQPTELRLERTLKNNISEYVFPVLTGDATILECENRLNPNDQMIVLEAGYGIYERNSSLADAAIKLIEKYPNVNAFTAGTTFVKAHLKRAWNGYLSVRRGTDLSLEKMPLRAFYEAGVTQQASATTFSSESTESAGKRQIMPRLVLRGGQQVEIKASYDSFATCLWEQDAANLNIQVVLTLGGFIVKGQDGKADISL